MKKAVFTIMAFVLVLSVSQIHAATTEVNMTSGLRFNPDTVIINAGDSVRWTNQSGLFHTSTSGENCVSNGIWDSGFLSSGQSFSRVFDQPGTFPYFCRVSNHCALGMVGTIIVQEATPVMSVPAGQFGFEQYPGISTPVVSADPAKARPIAVGSIAQGGNTLRITLETALFAAPVDVYFAIFAPSIADELFVLVSDGTLQASSSVGLEPWRSGITGPLNAPLFGDIPVGILPPGTYTLFFAVTPSGISDRFFLWSTTFNVA